MKCPNCKSEMLYTGETDVDGEPLPANTYDCKNADCPERLYRSQVIDR